MAVNSTWPRLLLHVVQKALALAVCCSMKRPSKAFAWRQEVSFVQSESADGIADCRVVRLGLWRGDARYVAVTAGHCLCSLALFAHSSPAAVLPLPPLQVGRGVR